MRKTLLSRILALSLAIAIFASMSFSVDAAELSERHAIAQTKKELIADGFPEAAMPLLEKSDFNLYAREAIQCETSLYTIDELTSIEYYTNASRQQLLKDGYTEEQISEISANLDKLRNLSDKELANQYGRDEQEIKLLRMALAENDVAPLAIESDDLVTSSGTIGTNKLEIATLVQNQSNDSHAIAEVKKVISKRQEVIYLVGAEFSWQKRPVWTVSTDHIALGWNKSLSATGYGGIIMYKTNLQNDQYVMKGVSYTPYAGNGVKFSFKQLAWDSNYNVDAVIDGGMVTCAVFEERRQNLTAQLVVQYEHSRPGITGGSISVSSAGTIAISVGAGLISDFSVSNSNTSEYFSI